MTERSGDESQDALIARLRREADIRETDLARLREQLARAERELVDLRAIRDALTPPTLPERPGLEMAASFVPARAERVSGDFYLAARGPEEATVLVIGDVVGHGLGAARLAAFVRTAFVATAPFSDDPCQLLNWANTALTERAGTSTDYITAGCISWLPETGQLRWAYAGHPPALWLDDGRPLDAPGPAMPLGVDRNIDCGRGECEVAPGRGFVLYTDGLVEARHDGGQFGEEAASAALTALDNPSPSEAVATLRERVIEFVGSEELADDLCLLAARVV